MSKKVAKMTCQHQRVYANTQGVFCAIEPPYMKECINEEHCRERK